MVGPAHPLRVRTFGGNPRIGVCRGCEHHRLVDLQEQCELAPEWGCLFRASQVTERRCPVGKW